MKELLYDAKVRSSRLPRETWWDAELAERLEREAAQLKEQFNRDWLEDRQFFTRRAALTASSPQAWPTAAPLLLIRVLLGLAPKGDELESDPAVPATIGRLTLRGIPGRGATKTSSRERCRRFGPNRAFRLKRSAEAVIV